MWPSIWPARSAARSPSPTSARGQERSGLAMADELPVDGVTVWMTDDDVGRPRRREGQPGRDRPARRQRAHRQGFVVRRAAQRRASRRRRGQPAVRRRGVDDGRRVGAAVGTAPRAVRRSADGLDAIRRLVADAPGLAAARRLARAGDRRRPGTGRRRAARRPRLSATSRSARTSPAGTVWGSAVWAPDPTRTTSGRGCSRRPSGTERAQNRQTVARPDRSSAASSRTGRRSR